MAKTARSRARKTPPISRTDFIGAKMANFLFAVAHHSPTTLLDENTRKQALVLYKQWDSICSLRLTNPIVIAELERKFVTGGLK